MSAQGLTMGVKRAVREVLPCICGKGVVVVKRDIGHLGVLTFHISSAVPCPACGSTDDKAARAASEAGAAL